jgi:hypothetical protein
MANRLASVFQDQDDQPAVFYPVARALVGLAFSGIDSGLGSPSNPLAFPVIPKSAKVIINSYRQPDSWEMTFDARDLPFDPQKIRLGTVEISMYTTTGIQDEKRLLSRQFAESEDAAEFHQRGYIEVQKARQEQAALQASERKNVATENRRVYFQDNEPLICGMFDDAGIDCSGDGRWVTIAGQDWTALPIGRQWHPETGGRARRIPTGKRADEWAADILREIDPNGVLSVKVLGVDDLPVIGKSAISLHGRGIPIETNTSYWDVLYKTLTRHGLLCYFRGYELVLTRPRSVEKLQSDIRYLAWGANLERIRLDRHLGKQKVPKIILQCTDEDDVFTVQYPETGPGRKQTVLTGKVAKQTSQTQKIKAAPAVPTRHKRATAKTPMVKESDEYMIIPVHGVSDRKVLREYARTLHYLMGRGERKIVATTHHLLDLLGRPLLDLDVGDPVDIDWRDFNRDTLGAMSPERRFQELVDIGYQPEVAQAIADSYDDLVGVQRPLRVHEMTYEWSCDDGLELEMSALDFVTGGEAPENEQVLPGKLGKTLGRPS